MWLIPLIAALIGGWLAVKAIRERGPTIQIVFSTAEGLEAQKTRIKYRSLDIGHVTALAFTEDRTRIVATVELSRQAAPLLVADTRFWVVRPRISGTQVSGLGTLLSGAYIGMEAGSSSETRSEFVGIDVPPIVTVDRPGRHFKLHALDLGSLDVGSPVYFRRIEVGSIIAYELDADGAGVNLQVFINAPYDRYVKPDTRFWQASGFDVSLDASGLRVNTESVTSVLLGGVAFQTPVESVQAPVAEDYAEFLLYADRAQALRLPDTADETYTLTFGESVRGLAVGAPVDFRGVVVGEVSAIGVDFDPETFDVRVPVEIHVYPDRLRGAKKGLATAQGALIDKLVARGLRAQLRSGSLVTGQLYVALDFFPDAPKTSLARQVGQRTLPTVAGSLEELQTTLLALVRRLDKLPLEGMIADSRKSLKALESTLGAAEKAVQRVDGEVLPQATRTLADLSRTLGRIDALASDNAPLQRDVSATLREVSRAAESLRSLADYLERNPDALLRGRSVEAAQ